MTQDWTPDRIKLLTDLWSEGLATGEIGRRLGFTKNAVIGKAHRLGLPKRQSPIQRAAAAKKPPREATSARKAPAEKPVTETPVAAAPKPEPKPKPAPKAPPQVAVTPPSPHETVTLDRLSHGMCCWPTGEPGTPDFHFCGNPTVPGKPYCLPHCQVAYVKSSKGDRSNRNKAAQKTTAAA
ncbi:GcrA family cell cycle regulator [Magnetospira thiophila]